MFCSKCGKEIADEALICPMCGCATINYKNPTTSNTACSNDYVAIKEFEDKVKSIHVVGVISLVLFLGIGIIFSFVVWFKAVGIHIPKVTTTHPNEIAMLESAKRKLKSALTFATLPFYPLIIFGFSRVAAGFPTEALIFIAVLLGIMLFIGVPCTKHLNAELYGAKK